MRHVYKIIAAGLLLAGAPAIAAVPVDLYKSPDCGCCENYIAYLKNQGFGVNVIDSANMAGIRKKLGSDRLSSCHTMVVNGYTVEGHVPVSAIDKLLKTAPKIAGISVPGMPQNAPGMGTETKGTLKIYQIDKNQAGKPRVFSVE